MEIQCIDARKQDQLEDTKLFLATMGLTWDDQIQYTVNILEDGEIIATGSLDHNVLKCISVSPKHQGEGLAATLVSELVKYAMADGHRHLFIFTSPKNTGMFHELGFHDVAVTGDMALLENVRDGIRTFVQSLPHFPGEQHGCIVANCNPFTNGHLYLIEQAAALCDLLYVFILSEQRSFFPAEERMEMACAATAHLTNVSILPTSDYLISSATFPDYFIKEKLRSPQIRCELDIRIFADYFAGPLGIKTRYVGTEPFDPVTGAYNEQMKILLPRLGIALYEIPRHEIHGEGVSASRVRALLQEQRFDDIHPLVPDYTYRYLWEKHGNEQKKTF